MLFIPVPNAIQVELIFDQAGQITENVYHFVSPAAPSIDDLGNLGNALASAWNNDLQAVMHTGMILFRVRVTDLSSETAGVADNGGQPEWHGTASGDMLPNNVAMVATLVTGNRGRSYRGRIFFGGFAEGQQADSEWQSSAVNAVTAYLIEIQTLPVGTLEYNLGVVSRFHNGAPRTTGVITPVQTTRVNTTVASQRRRLPGRGR